MSVLLSDPRPSYRDPLDIERLADDLALRQTSANGHTSRDDEDGELPEDIPLSHNDKYLTAEVFDVEEFLLARSRTSLPDLRTELRTYLAELKEELVQLINDDYEAFISLSTDLRDEGTRLERLKHPLGGIKASVIESKQELQAIQDEIHDKLANRNKLREEKALLHLLLKISESITRLESLLLITPPETTTAQPIELKSRFVMLPGGSSDSADDRFRGSKAKHLSRVSAEYTQLLYHVKKAQAENCAYVDEVQWRIDRLKSTLSSDLDMLFATTLMGLTDTKAESRLSDLERSKLMTDLSECLKTYDMLGLWRDAEDVFRREVVRGFVKKTIHPGGLTAPHSPIVPNTPFHFAGPPTTTASTPHQIPYTPFTAFIPKQAVFRLSSDVPQAHLLDDADDSLAKLYNQLLRFVERDACAIMNAAEKLTGKNAKTPANTLLDSLATPVRGNADEDVLEQDREGSPSFDFLANVVWDELGRTIMDEIGSIVFAAGKPNEFRKHYETTQGFIRSLELLAPSMEAIDSMRQHPTYVAFERRWQLPVYFQLRWKEIVGALEDMFAVGYLDPITPKDGSFSMPQSSATWIAISACWSSDIYIPELSHRFWKLTLQILSRYSGWLSKIVTSSELTSKPSLSVQQDKSNGPTRAATPDVSAESGAADDSLLRQYAAALVDISILEKNVLNLWSQVISVMLPNDDAETELRTEDALRESLSLSTELTASVSSNIVAILTKRCCEGLLPVRNIPAQFRAMSNKRMPTEPSYFIPSILRPVKQFFAIGTQEGPGSLLRDQFLAEYATGVFDNVAQKYISYLAAMKKMEVSLKRMVRTPFSLFGGSSARDEGKDEERIRAQMILDVEAFGKDAESLQVTIKTNTHFSTLKELVYANDQE